MSRSGRHKGSRRKKRPPVAGDGGNRFGPGSIRTSDRSATQEAGAPEKDLSHELSSRGFIFASVCK